MTSYAEYAEGDIHSEKQGTCARANGGKVAFHLIPIHLMVGVARVFMHGTLKYSPWNWAKGGKWSTPFDCMLRHLFKWWYCCEDIDPESGQHHLDHAIANLLFLRHYQLTYQDGDDRPPRSAHFHEWLEEVNQLFKPGGAEGLDRSQNVEEANRSCTRCGSRPGHWKPAKDYKALLCNECFQEYKDYMERYAESVGKKQQARHERADEQEPTDCECTESEECEKCYLERVTRQYTIDPDYPAV